VSAPKAQIISAKARRQDKLKGNDAGSRLDLEITCRVVDPHVPSTVNDLYVLVPS
jgi:hypothetical protein